jgi:hypothetical protein
LYTADFQAALERHGLHPHSYADDVQINGSAKPLAVALLQSQLSACIDDVASCIRCNHLQLIMAKTEIMRCNISHRQQKPPTTVVRVGLFT